MWSILDDSHDLLPIIESSDDDDEITSDDEQQITIEEINYQTTDLRVIIFIQSLR